MQLADFMSEARLTDAAFADLIGRDRTSVMRWRKGETRPDWEALQKIAAHTEGAVTPNDFLPAAASWGMEAKPEAEDAA